MVRLSSYVNPVFSQHVEPAGHPERQQRYEAALRGVQASRVCSQVVQQSTRVATEEEALRVHSQEHLDRLAALAGRSGQLDADTFYSPHSYEAALHAAGAACLMVKDLLAGETDYGFVPTRPPGHHAEGGKAMGFCLLNNAAIAAAAARAQGISRVAILDWDVHHGNGTEAIFYDDPSVLYVSMHESPQYPGTGARSDVGEGSGRGYTVNLPLSTGANDAVYLQAMDRVVLPVIDAFAPEFVLVSAGYDAHVRDPLGGMRVTQDGFGAMMVHLLDRLPQRGRGRVGVLLEGGYDLKGLEQSVAATLSAFDPSAQFALTEQSVGARWADDIQRARTIQAPLWELS